MRRNLVILFLLVLVLGAILIATLNHYYLWFFGFMGFLLVVGIIDSLQKKNSILRNYPVVGHMRYLLREIAPEIHQYFVEDNIDGRPLNKRQLKLINDRANLNIEMNPFGTQLDVYKEGSEWIAHSMFPSSFTDELRVIIGGVHCRRKYSASLLNVSAMSFGALSGKAIMALNLGAKKGGYYHNTGEGGASPYHFKYGGDLVWQIGTGYFGCRTLEGRFCPESFKKTAIRDEIKMIEIKLSQGAKPGHGGVLPAIKNTEEIAEIRGVKPHTEVLSPPGHTRFNTADGLIDFICELRKLSGYKPIGFKICIGEKTEFLALCEAMMARNEMPDFITVDGAEGGTGAAPLEFSNHVGMPGEEALVFVIDTLKSFGLKKHIRVIYSGKVISGFDVIRALSIGADLCNSARGMMISAGCIQSRRCHDNTCPTGVATQNKTLQKGLDVVQKSERAKNFHAGTMESVRDILCAAGISRTGQINRGFLYRRQEEKGESLRLSEIYPEVEGKGSTYQDD